MERIKDLEHALSFACEYVCVVWQKYIWDRQVENTKVMNNLRETASFCWEWGRRKLTKGTSKTIFASPADLFGHRRSKFKSLRAVTGCQRMDVSSWLFFPFIFLMIKPGNILSHVLALPLSGLRSCKTLFVTRGSSLPASWWWLSQLCPAYWTSVLEESSWVLCSSPITFRVLEIQAHCVW